MTDTCNGACTHPRRKSAGIARSACADCGRLVCFSCGRPVHFLDNPNTGERTYTRTCGNAVCLDEIKHHYE